MARPRTGQFVTRRNPDGSLRHLTRATVYIDGKVHRLVYDLCTSDPKLALRKHNRLVRELNGPQPDVKLAAFVAAKPDSLADYFERWQEAYPTNDSDGDEQRFRDYVPSHVKAMALVDVKPAHIREVLQGVMDAGRSAASAHKVRSLLHRMFERAWKDEIVQSNPVAKTDCPRDKVARKKRVIMTDAELSAACSVPQVSLKLRTLWLAQRFTGMRSGDSTSLLWEDINWAEHEVNVPNNKTRDPRIITMHQVFEDKLRAWWEESGRPTSGLVFPTSKGTQYAKRGTTFAAQLREALKRAGVTRRELFEETDRTLPVDDHSIRRLYCTSLASAGVNLQTAMNLAGHTSADVHSRYLRVTKSMTTLPGGAIDGFADGIVSAEHSLNHIKTATNEATPSPHMGE